MTSRDVTDIWNYNERENEMKRIHRRLSLHAETLRTMSKLDLGLAVGGLAIASGPSCPACRVTEDASCPTCVKDTDLAKSCIGCTFD